MLLRHAYYSSCNYGNFLMIIVILNHIYFGIENPNELLITTFRRFDF